MYRENKGGRPLKFPDVVQLQERIDNYFKECEDNEKPLTVSGLACALDTSRETLINYSNKEMYFDTIQKAKDKITAFAETQLYTNRNVAGVIFSLKNNHGYKDKIEVTETKENKGLSAFLGRNKEEDS